MTLVAIKAWMRGNFVYSGQMGRTVCVIKPLCGVLLFNFFPVPKSGVFLFLFFSFLSFYYLRLYSILVYFEARRKKQRGELYYWHTFSDANLEGGIYFFP